MKYAFLSLVILLTISSCSEYSEFNEESFPGNGWDKSTTIVFNPEIKDAAHSQIFIQLRYVEGVKHKSIETLATIISPSGTSETIPVVFQLEDGAGNTTAECMGDYCDLKIPFNYPITDNGVYKISFAHSMPMDVMGGIMGMGIEVKKK